MSWSDERTWKHEHFCRCGRSVPCYNPSCSEPEFCQDCAKLMEEPTDHDSFDEAWFAGHKEEAC